MCVEREITKAGYCENLFLQERELLLLLKATKRYLLLLGNNVYSYSLNKSDFCFKFVLAKILLYSFLFRRIEEELGANAKFAGEKFRRPLE